MELVFLYRWTIVLQSPLCFWRSVADRFYLYIVSVIDGLLVPTVYGRRTSVMTDPAFTILGEFVKVIFPFFVLCPIGFTDHVLYDRWTIGLRFTNPFLRHLSDSSQRSLFTMVGRSLLTINICYRWPIGFNDIVFTTVGRSVLLIRIFSIVERSFYRSFSTITERYLSTTVLFRCLADRF